MSRPRKPIVPTGRRPAKAPSKPAKAKSPAKVSPDTLAPPNAQEQALAATEAIRRELAAALSKSTQGQRLANHEMRLIRDAWLHDQAMHLWPSLVAAAADLSISPATLRNFADQGCPGVEPHSAIPKAPVLAWLLKRAHERGGDRGATSETIEDVELRIKQAKLETTERRVRELRQQILDEANQGIVQAMAGVRTHLATVLPAQLAQTLRTEPDQQAAEHAAAALIENALRTIPAIAAPEPKETP